MEIKKSPKADLQKWRGVFFEAGLAFVMITLFVAFEWESSEIEIQDFGPLVTENIEAEEIPITRQEEIEPPKEIEQPKPQVQLDQLIIAEDDAEIQEEAEFQDTEADEDSQVEQVEQIEEEEESVKEEEIFTVVEKMPEPAGGMLAMRKFLAENVDYPEIARENEIQGRVFISFVVNGKGEVCKIKVARGVDPALDKAAIAVVEKMGKTIKWTPGTQRDKPVSVSFTVPINFMLSTK